MSSSKILADSTMLNLRSLVVAVLGAFYVLQKDSNDATARRTLREANKALESFRQEPLTAESLGNHYEISLDKLGLTSGVFSFRAGDSQSMIEKLWKINSRLKEMVGDRIGESIDSEASRYAHSAI